MKTDSLLFGQTDLYSPLHLTFDLDLVKVQLTYRVFKRIWKNPVLLFTTVEWGSVPEGKCFWPYNYVEPLHAPQGSMEVA